MSSHNYTSVEDLLFATLDAVSRFRVGQREAVGAALEAGGLLTEAKGRLQHGEWGDWIGRGWPCVANGLHVDEVSRHGPDGLGDN